MRIAFFGGSFDPPHPGHLRIAQAAADRLQLDRILFAPVALQPLKRALDAVPASFADRVAMLRLMLDQAPDAACERRFAVSELDAPRTDSRPNYTYDTLLQLRATLAPSDELFVLTGADSFLTIRQWHRASELIFAANWIVAARPGVPLRRIDDALPAGITAGQTLQLPTYEQQQLTSPQGQSTTLYLLPDLDEDVSATAIRSAMANHADPDPPPLAPAVLAYIRERGLYQ